MPLPLSERESEAGGLAGEAITDAESSDLRGRSVRGTYWSGAAFAVQNVLRLVGNLVVAALLAPQFFGLAALVNVVIHGLQMLSDLGIGAAIVQRPQGEKEAFLRTSFTLQAVRGGGLFLLACGLAWPAALIYEEPSLAWLIPMAATGLIAAGLTSTGLHRSARRLRLDKLAVLEVGTSVLGIAGMVAWASVQESILALVVPPVLAQFVKAGASHLLMRDRRDRFGWDAESASLLVTFSRWILLSTTLAFLTQQADRLIFGGLIPLELLGVYNIALMLAVMPRQLVLKLGQEVAFPAMSRVDQAEFPLAALRVRRPLAVMGGLMTSGLIASGPALILAAYDDRYAAASWILPVLAAGGWLEVLGGVNGATLLSRGRTRDLAVAQGVKLLFLVTGLLTGHALAGFPGAVVGVAVSELGGYGVSVWFVRRLGVRTTRPDLLATLAVGAVGGFGFLVGWSTARFLIDTGMGNTVAHLLAFIAAGLTVSIIWLRPVLRALQDVRRR
jgi:O-antigen/teichoic acid export membrane protein